MRKLLLGGVALAFAGPALAADMPAKAPVYVGWTDDSDVTVVPLPNPAGPLVPQFDLAADARSVVAGVQAGYNVQFATNWVAGIEIDASWTKLDGTSTIQPVPRIGGAAINPFSFTTVSREVDWLATVRGRLGFAWDRWLVYATGGYAYGRFNYAAVTNFTDVIYPVAFSEHKDGWVVGGGIEFAQPSVWWSGGAVIFRAEYLYYDLDSASASSNGIPNNAPVGFRYEWENVLHVVRVGMSYKFGGSAVVAKY
jgi:outer membrane immunogenic protein